MKLTVRGIPGAHAQALRSGGPDANGQAALQQLAEGQGNPCRHCLQLIAPGEEMLVLAYRPFDQLQPYAELGPIFLHSKACERHDSDALPRWFEHLQPALIRGYGNDDRIRYETGQVVPGAELGQACRQILADPAVAYVHIRSKFNCFQCRVERG